MRTIVCLLCVIMCVFGLMGLGLADGIPNDLCNEEESLSCFSDEEADSCTMYVDGQPFVRLRQIDSTNQPYIDQMPYGSMVTVVSTQFNEAGEEWSLVIYNERYGYCMTRYLTCEVDVPASEACPVTRKEAFGTALLQQGNKTPDYRVKNLQLCLMEGGFLNDDKGADGYFGRNTYKALRTFQKSQGLDQVGHAGKTTKTRVWYLYADFLMENGVMQ